MTQKEQEFKYINHYRKFNQKAEKGHEVCFQCIHNCSSVCGVTNPRKDFTCDQWSRNKS